MKNVKDDNGTEKGPNSCPAETSSQEYLQAAATYGPKGGEKNGKMGGVQVKVPWGPPPKGKTRGGEKRFFGTGGSSDPKLGVPPQGIESEQNEHVSKTSPTKDIPRI